MSQRKMVKTENSKTAFDQLTDRLERYPSLDKMHVQRNLALGASAASLIILVELFGVGVEGLPLRISLFACAASIPSWVGLAGLLEYYIILGPKSYAHRRTQFAQVVIGLLFLTGGLGSIIAVSGIIYHLTPAAAYAFGVIVFAVLAASLAFHAHLAHWYNHTKGNAGRPHGDT